jgi:hypothetical protein
MTDRDSFLAALDAAIKPPVRDVRTVQMDTPDGHEILLYTPESDGQYTDGGTLVIPAGMLDS